MRQQLVKWPHPTLEIRGSNPVIGQYRLLSTVLKLYSKDKDEEKEAGYGTF